MPYIDVIDVTGAFAHANIEAGHDIKAIQEKKMQCKCKIFPAEKSRGPSLLIRPK